MEKVYLSLLLLLLLGRVYRVCMYWYLCAVMASNKAESDPTRARGLGNASNIMSAAGIFVSFIVVIIVVVLYSNGELYPYCPGYVVQGTCYRHRLPAYPGVDCFEGVRYDGYCYYN